MRASRVLVVIIVINVLLGVLAASVVLSPEYAAIDSAVRKGAAVPSPVPPTALPSRPDWKQELLPRRARCGPFCRARRALVLRCFSEDELLRAYHATH